MRQSDVRYPRLQPSGFGLWPEASPTARTKKAGQWQEEQAPLVKKAAPDWFTRGFRDGMGMQEFIEATNNLVLRKFPNTIQIKGNAAGEEGEGVSPRIPGEALPAANKQARCLRGSSRAL